MALSEIIARTEQPFFTNFHTSSLQNLVLIAYKQAYAMNKGGLWLCPV